LRYGSNSRIITHMKTTIDLDERRLAKVMDLTGLKTRRAAVDYALRTAERQAAFERLMERALPDEVYRTALDPKYDVEALRQRERP
jgi:Arc/MetJ family transcription regulator